MHHLANMAELVRRHSNVAVKNESFEDENKENRPPKHAPEESFDLPRPKPRVSFGKMQTRDYRSFKE